MELLGLSATNDERIQILRSRVQVRMPSTTLQCQSNWSPESQGPAGESESGISVGRNYWRSLPVRSWYQISLELSSG